MGEGEGIVLFPQLFSKTSVSVEREKGGNQH